MNRYLSLAVSLGAAALLALVACDELFPGIDDFTPTGTPFDIHPGIEVVSIKGSLRHFSPHGQFALDMTAAADPGPVLDTLPAGLLFRSLTALNQVQHMLMLKPHVVEVASETVCVLGVFCCNERREIPDDLDSFEIGPITDNGGLREIADLVRDRDISGALGMVQRAVWLVTDSTGLTEAYRDSLAALPSAGGRLALVPGPYREVEPGYFGRLKRELRRGFTAAGS